MRKGIVFQGCHVILIYVMGGSASARRLLVSSLASRTFASVTLARTTRVCYAIFCNTVL